MASKKTAREHTNLCRRLNWLRDSAELAARSGDLEGAQRATARREGILEAMHDMGLRPVWGANGYAIGTKREPADGATSTGSRKRARGPQKRIPQEVR